jgi:glycosyltransferase involved in cell wall biosynthesis
MSTLPVSVVIPAHNREELIADALRSVHAQRPAPPAEVIVVDDCSSDRTAAVAAEYGARVIGHPENRGAGAARNTGIDAARSPWIAMLDSDDEWLPHHLGTLWRHREGRVLVAGAALAVGKDEDELRYAGAVSAEPLELASPAQVVFPENPLPTSGVLVRREAVLAAGGFDPLLRYAEDFDLWLRVLEQGRAVALPVIVYHWRRHGGSKSGQRHGPRDTQRSIVRSYAGRPWWSPGLAERRDAVAEWDDLRLALREGRRRDTLRSAAWIASRRARLAGVAGLLAHRRRVRRRTAQLVAHGR